MRRRAVRPLGDRDQEQSRSIQSVVTDLSNARLNLRLVCETVFAGDIRKREQMLSASITVATASEIKLLLLSYQAAGENISPLSVCWMRMIISL